MKKNNGTIISLCIVLLAFLIVPSVQAAGYTRLAVIPFDNVTGNPNLDWLEEGLAYGLTGKLEIIGGLMLIDRLAVSDAASALGVEQINTVNEKGASLIGKLIGAQYVVIGSYKKRLGKLVIVAEVVDVESATVYRKIKVKGKPARAIEIQNELTEVLMRSIGIETDAKTIERMKSIPTDNDDIFKNLALARKALLEGKSADAKKYFEEVLAADGTDPEAVMGLGFAGLAGGDHSAAIDFFIDAIEAYLEKDRPRKAASALNNIGVLFFYGHEYDKAIFYFGKSMEFSAKAKDEPGVAKALSSIGDVYFNDGQNEKALENYTKSLDIWRKVEHAPSISKLVQNIGIIYKESDRHEEALKYFGESLEISRTIGDEPGASKSLYTIGGVYEAQRNHSEALKYYNLSIEISRKIGDERGLAFNLWAAGRCLRYAGNINEAIKAWEEAIAHFENVGDRHNAEKLRKLTGDSSL